MGDRDPPGIFLIGYRRACVFHCSFSLFVWRWDATVLNVAKGPRTAPWGTPKQQLSVFGNVIFVLLRIQILGNPGNVKKTTTRYLKPAHPRPYWVSRNEAWVSRLSFTCKLTSQSFENVSGFATSHSHRYLWCECLMCRVSLFTSTFSRCFPSQSLARYLRLWRFFYAVVVHLWSRRCRFDVNKLCINLLD